MMMFEWNDPVPEFLRAGITHCRPGGFPQENFAAGSKVTAMTCRPGNCRRFAFPVKTSFLFRSGV